MHPFRFIRERIVSAFGTAESLPKFLSLRDCTCAGILLLCLVSKIPAFSATVVRPTVEYGAQPPATLALKPATKVLIGVCEWDDFIHVPPIILASASVLVDQFHAEIVHAEPDAAGRLSAQVT